MQSQFLMRGKLVALLALLYWTTPAQAQEPRFGAALDLGLPDGLMASFAYRAHRKLTTQAGIGHNSNSPGLRVGFRYLPIDYVISPYGALEAGHYGEAETPDWMRDAARSAGLDDKTLDSVGYQYANGHLGARIGSSQVAMTLQMGLSFIRANTLIIKPKPNYSPPVDLYRETTIHAWIISGRVGVHYWF